MHINEDDEAAQTTLLEMEYALKVLRQNHHELNEEKEDEAIMKMRPSLKVVSPDILEETDSDSFN